MAISTLSTLATDYFKGLRRLFGSQSADLVGRLNVYIAKINEILDVVNGSDSFDTLSVGTGTGVYYGSSDSWFQVDGTNPPTLSAFRIQNQANGAFVTVTYDSGLGGFQFA